MHLAVTFWLRRNIRHQLPVVSCSETARPEHSFSLLESNNHALEIFPARGTSGDLRHPSVPDTVAPFRAWRGSRDLVAQSPKFHAPAVAHPIRVRREKSSTAPRTQPESVSSASSICVARPLLSRGKSRSAFRAMIMTLGFAAAGASGGCTSDGFTQFTFERPRAVDLYDGLAFAQTEVPHLFRHCEEIPDVHRLQLCFVKRFSHPDQKSSFQHGSGVRPWDASERNSDSVGTAGSQDERRASAFASPNWRQSHPFSRRNQSSRSLASHGRTPDRVERNFSWSGWENRFDEAKLQAMNVGISSQCRKRCGTSVCCKRRDHRTGPRRGPFKVNWVNPSEVQPPDAPAAAKPKS